MARVPTFIPDLLPVSDRGIAYAFIRLPKERILKVFKLAQELETSGEAEVYRLKERAGLVARREDDGDDGDAAEDLAVAAVRFFGRRRR